ncbi:MAG: hypothetical protein MH219_20280 [Marinobacter sp.]|nr:hypothetical protein [Marinobacter sp.]
MSLVSPEIQELRGAWLGLRLILGAILGLVIGLYFVGAIQETPATFAKIAALSVLAGYAAPKVWAAQDKIVSAKINKIVSSVIGDVATSSEKTERCLISAGTVAPFTFRLRRHLGKKRDRFISRSFSDGSDLI